MDGWVHEWQTDSCPCQQILVACCLSSFHCPFLYADEAVQPYICWRLFVLRSNFHWQPRRLPCNNMPSPTGGSCVQRYRLQLTIVMRNSCKGNIPIETMNNLDGYGLMLNLASMVIESKPVATEQQTRLLRYQGSCEHNKWKHVPFFRRAFTSIWLLLGFDAIVFCRSNNTHHQSRHWELLQTLLFGRNELRNLEDTTGGQWHHFECRWIRLPWHPSHHQLGGDCSLAFCI